MSNINLDQNDKDNLIAPNRVSSKSDKQLWKLYRDKALSKITAETSSISVLWLKYIVIMLVKIYWELRKPKRGE